MKAVAKTEPAGESLRDAHKDLTRGRILDAALGLVRERGELTIAGVAARAGMTERTIYRHFATRDELLSAVWAKVNERQTIFLPATPEELIQQPKGMFAEFDAQAALTRAILSSEQGRELRLSVNAERQARFRSVVRAARPDIKEPELTPLCAAVQLLDSAYAWMAMKDYWGLDGAEAGEAASEAIARLLSTPATSSKKGKAS